MDTNDILIASYLRDELSSEDKQLFLAKLANDTTFKEQFLLEKQFFETYNNEYLSVSKEDKAVQDYKVFFASEKTQELKAIIKAENDRYQASQQTKSFNKKWILAVAAVLVFSLGLFQFLANKKDNQQLYASYIEATNMPSLLTRGDNENQLSKAKVFFDNKQYQKALDLFKKQENSPAIYIYSGVSQMNLNQFDSAEKTFDTLINSDFIDAQKGLWFKALLYLKQGKEANAKVLLEEIIAKNYYNTAKAKTLLADL